MGNETSLAELEELKKKVHELQCKNDILEKQNEAFQQIQANNQETLELLQLDYAAIQPRYECYVHKYGELSRSDFPVNEQSANPPIFDLSSMLSARNSALTASTLALQQDVKDLQDKLNEANLRLAEKEKIDVNEVAELRKRIESLLAEKEKFTQVFLRAKRHLNSLIIENEQLKGSIASGGYSVDDFKKKDTQIAQLTETVSMLEESLAKGQAAVQNLQQEFSSKLNALEQSNSKLSQDKAKLIKDNEQLLRKITDKDKELSSVTEQLQQSSEKCKSLEAQLQQHRQAYAQVNKLIGNLGG